MARSALAQPVDALPYHLETIPDKLKRRAKAELFEDEDCKIRSLKLLRSMLQEDTDLRWQDEDQFLLAFLRARKFDVKKAYHLVKHMYTVFGKYENIHYNWTPDDLRKVIEQNSIIFLPYRDDDGSAVLIYRLSAWDPSITTNAENVRLALMGAYHAIQFPATQIAGFKLIFDFSGFSLRQLLAVSPSTLWLVVEVFQSCFPGRFRAVHVVNQNLFFSGLWTMARPMMSKKLKERFHFHGDDLQKLHEYFHPSILPAELGGELPPMDNTEWGRMLLESLDYLNHVMSFGYEKYLKKVQQRKKEKS